MPSTSEAAVDLPDVNVLVALTNAAHIHHDVAHAWFEQTVAFATCPITESGLIRLTLNPAVTGRPLSREDAVAVLDSVRTDSRARFLSDGSSLASPAVDLIGLVGHRQVTDLHLINLAATSGARLVTLDRRIAETLTPADREFVHLIG